MLLMPNAIDELPGPIRLFRQHVAGVFVQLDLCNALTSHCKLNNAKWLLWPFRTASTDLGKDK
jgi:hypothetical protein